MTKPKIITIVGARPQFIKMGMVSRLLRKQFKEIILHTGQHYDKEMSHNLFQSLNLPQPEYNLGIVCQDEGEQIGRMLIGIEKVLLEENPMLVIVYGDTNSTLAGALAAAKLKISLVHVEAGLRGFNLAITEEINRVIADHLSSFLFCPTKTAVANLKREGINKNIFLVGDVMYDSICHYLPIAQKKSKILSHFKIKPKKYYLLTIHRAQNTVDAERISQVLSDIDNFDIPTVFPVHPRTRKFLNGIFRPKKNLIFTLPVSYPDILILEKNAKVILTDSGGVQKEAYILGVPCFTLRQETEWLETLKYGCNRLLDFYRGDFSLIPSYTIKAEAKYNPNVYGDGHAAEKIVKILAEAVRDKKCQK